MPSGFDFEPAGDSVVRYFVSNYLLRVAVNVTCMGALLWLNAETVERAPTPRFCRLLRFDFGLDYYAFQPFLIK